ncbi:alpha-glucan family phosphorylase [Candidatus Nitronereus thalassa]|uniref:Alpha-glucan family phosphorylase n=1 Tax=Candidatus Nitronereus thalassa TaxID=3020898 RepID=A0ABU3K7G9_9BACT|nr:alpha-glucan family phosphorylase [Candidatus Nitronereus thalassa]MDT7042389.1 alpha-glucan family phosphorylase [Candidatus Nitronereus thalassa]
MNNHGALPTSSYFFHRPMPEGLEGLNDLALDLRWTWSHFSDRLWERLDHETWERTGNPYFILQSVSQARLEEAAQDLELRRDLQSWLKERKDYLKEPGWFGATHATELLQKVAYFSMEFGLSEALPIYSGGLGILAGDHLKTASDLGVPIVGIGLLYQQGYFRQILSPESWQAEAFPYNDPISLPVMPVPNLEGGWLRVKLQLPGRTLLVRVWQANVGKVRLFLLDSNDPLNAPRDRSITANLYPGGQEQRLIQEMVLGIGGWHVLEDLGYQIDICHLNEGHAAFVVFARARSCMMNTGLSFYEALWTTRAGNVFTTHTPVEAAFDRYEPTLIRPYADYLADLLKISRDQLLAMGRQNPNNAHEPFNMAYLAMRGSGAVNGVSQLHGQVSRKIFQTLYARWPEAEIPVGHITNGVHVPSWDSPAADALWTKHCRKGRWIGTLDNLCSNMSQVTDEELWNFRVSQRLELIHYVRRRLERQLREHGAHSDLIQQAHHVLDPNVLTLGFARRFTAYKRPTLLLWQRERLLRLLSDPHHPVQLIVAGKAHPHDDEGKRLIQTWAQFATHADIRDRVVFLEDYEMALAQELVAGVDVWLNTPRRPLEASGTSGMKVLVNGGLNLSELDGWWAEAYTPEVGWEIGGEGIDVHPERDASEAERLYQCLEDHIVPEFYDRDQEGIPRTWVHRVRTSMSKLTPQFSSNRMIREYVERVYLPAAAAYRHRSGDEGKRAKDIQQWKHQLDEHWPLIRFGEIQMAPAEGGFFLEVQVYCGEWNPQFLCVELYADGLDRAEPEVHVMAQRGSLPGMVNTYVYALHLSTQRPFDHYTPRIIPFHPDISVPLEIDYIIWK